MLLSCSVERLEVQDYTFIEYLHERDAWKVGLVMELNVAKFGRVVIEDIGSGEVCNTLDYLLANRTRSEKTFIVSLVRK